MDAIEELVESFDTTEVPLNAMNESNPELSTNNEIDLQIEQMIDKNEEGLWNCKVCGKTLSKKYNVKRHAETHIDGMSHVCHICSKIFPNRPNLQSHIYDNHSELSSCDICGKSGMNRAVNRDLKRRHKKTVSFPVMNKKSYREHIALKTPSINQ